MAGFNYRWRKIPDAPAPREYEIKWESTGRSYKGWNDACSWRGCKGKQIVAEVMYDYVTGRQGRITDSRKCVCQEHLDKWLKKNPQAKEVDPRSYHGHWMDKNPLANVNFEQKQ